MAAVALAVAGCSCPYPITRTFGTNDNFAAVPADPVPYNPAYPPFVTFLNNNGIPSGVLATFDNPIPNRHVVATLRHGLRSCFPGATSLKLCFHAHSVSGQSTNDGVVIYDTNLTNNTFQVIHNSSIAPALIPTWTSNMTATPCIDLTAQMQANHIGDMLQFRVEDDTEVDYIQMILQ